MATLERSKRDLLDTVVRAPSAGVITNLQLADGQFVSVGQAVLTFVDSEIIWIESQLRENSLEYLKPGNAADVVLDVHPGRVYPARVESVGWGVNSRNINPSTGLLEVKNDKGWVRETQRFAVRVQFDPESRPQGIRIGSQANVVVYTGKCWLTDFIGRLWILLVSYLTYLS
jgi:multidrug resistance efflux pump